MEGWPLGGALEQKQETGHAIKKKHSLHTMEKREDRLEEDRGQIRGEGDEQCLSSLWGGIIKI